MDPPLVGNPIPRACGFRYGRSGTVLQLGLKCLIAKYAGRAFLYPACTSLWQPASETGSRPVRVPSQRLMWEKQAELRPQVFPVLSAGSGGT